MEKTNYEGHLHATFQKLFSSHCMESVAGTVAV